MAPIPCSGSQRASLLRYLASHLPSLVLQLQPRAGSTIGRTNSLLLVREISSRGLWAVNLSIFIYTDMFDDCILDSNTAGLIAEITSVAYGGAVQILACASIGSGMTFRPSTGHTL